MPAGPVPDRVAFVGGLRAELAALQEFCQILRAEQDALMRRDVEAILKLSEVKSEQVERLSALASIRAAYLDSLHLPTDRRGMAEWLVVHGRADQPELSRLWHQLLEAASEAQSINQSNGALIGVRLQHNQAALTTLHAAARRHTLYRPDGQTDVGATSRELGRA
jgi:flagella synthesis protein FlgN